MISEANNPEDFSKNYFNYLKVLIDQLAIEAVGKFIEMILEARENNKTIFFIGNGGSASTASHFVNDISLGSRQFEKPFRAIFLQQLQTQAKENDILVAISASGNSPNVIKAIDWANDNGLSTVGLSAFDGGQLAKKSNLNIHVPTQIGEYGPAEDLHMVICGLVGSFFRAYFKDAQS